MPRNTPAESVQSFMQRAADQFAQIATAKTVKDGGLAASLDGARIRGEIAATGSGPVTVTVTVDENHGLPKGMSRGQLTAEALAEFDAKALAEAKQRVWSQVRYMDNSRQLTGEKAIELLTALGYGAASQPSAVTTCTVSIPARRKDGHDTRSLKLAGNVTREDIVARVSEAIVRDGDNGHLRADQVLMTAFGDDYPTPALVEVSNYNVETVWPDKSEFAE